MTTNRFRKPDAPGASGEAAVPAAAVDQILNLADVAEFLRCSPEEAKAFLTEQNVVGVEFSSGPRYLRSDVMAVFLTKLQSTRVKLAEASKLDEIQNAWVAWLNKVQPTLTPSEQDGWVKFARYLVSKRLTPVEFFKRAPEERQHMSKLSGIDFRLRDDYGNAHVGLDVNTSSGIAPMSSGARATIPTTPRPGSRPFGS